MFKGVNTALVTPFSDGEIDEKAFVKHIEDQITAGVHGLVPCGTTGESATLSHEEHQRVVKLTVDVVKGRVKVIAGAGSNSTREAIKLTEHAQKVGADGALLITPYYNKPTQKGLVEHYRKVALNVDIPLVLYNVPGRTGVNMAPSTVAELATLKNIVANKEASGSVRQACEIIIMCKGDMSLISGEDALAFPLLCVGAVGVISVTSNLVPGDMVTMFEAFEDGRLRDAREWHYRLYPLYEAMFLETNPIPVKTALSITGRISPEVRLPLSPLSPENKGKLEGIMREYGII